MLNSLCKVNDFDIHDYSWYIQIKIVSKFNRLRSLGKLHKGTKPMLGGTYVGEIDEDGKACGIGELSGVKFGILWTVEDRKQEVTLKGMFDNDKTHGII